MPAVLIVSLVALVLVIRRLARTNQWAENIRAAIADQEPRKVGP